MAVISVAATTSAAQALPVNAGRQGLTLENSDANRCYVMVGPGTPTSTSYSFSLAQNESALLSGCRERIAVVWGTAGTGALLATEY